MFSKKVLDYIDLRKIIVIVKGVQKNVAISWFLCSKINWKHNYFSDLNSNSYNCGSGKKVSVLKRGQLLFIFFRSYIFYYGKKDIFLLSLSIKDLSNFEVFSKSVRLISSTGVCMYLKGILTKPVATPAFVS